MSNEMMTVKQAAELWNVSERRVTTYCKSGRIAGAYKEGRSWRIPADASQPGDNRMNNPITSEEKNTGKLSLPIGISDYIEASTKYYYVDKTMLIKEFLDERPMVSLFTRPRRFGKTLNMDMLRVFFEKTEEDTSKDKAIWSCGKYYQNYQGKYPVVFVTFKDVKCNTWAETYDMICDIFANEFDRHKELLDSDKCSVTDKEYFARILNKEASQADVTVAFLMLSEMLDEHHGVKPIIIIDEYDIPIQQGHMRGFYDEVILFMRNLFSGGLKDNRHLSYGFLTGILRVAKESIFSGLNNLKINSILDNKYSEYFGFTAGEVKEMAAYYGASDKFEEICEWYDGYRFGKSDIFNPWSVINYFSYDCEPRAFWQSTGSNDIIGEVLENADEDIYERLNALLKGETFLTYVDTGVIYPQIKNNPSTIYSFLLVAGYLKAVKTNASFTSDFMCEVALPNREIAFVYNKEILQKLDNVIPQATSISIQEAIFANDADKLQKCLHKLLMQSASCYDTVGEKFYHGLVLGLCAMLDKHYYVTSNRESGEGRYDIQLMPRNNKRPGVLIELKAEKDCSEDKLKELSQAALQQIYDRKYDAEMLAKGITKILKYGVAFSGKKFEITAEFPIIP